MRFSYSSHKLLCLAETQTQRFKLSYIKAILLGLVRPLTLQLTAKQNNRGRGRGSTKRRSQRRNDGSMISGTGSVPADVATLVSRAPGAIYGFPNKMLTRLRYCDTIYLSNSAGGIARQVFNINSTFDPDQTSTGHQPLYRDTYAGIYDQYAVVAVKATVKIINNSSNPIHCGMFIDDDTTSSTSYNVLMEQNNGLHTLLPGINGSLSSHTFVLTWTAKKFLGIDPYTSQTYKTAVGSNPTEMSSLVVWYQPVDLSSTMSTWFQIQLEQTVLFSELTTPTVS